MAHTIKKPKSDTAYVVTLDFQYYHQTERGKLIRRIRDYEVEIPKGIKPADIMWYLRNRWFPSNIDRIDENGASVRVINITNRRAVNGAGATGSSAPGSRSAVSEMNLEELQAFADENELPVEVSQFSDIGKARAQVSDMYDNKRLLAKRKKEEEAQAAANTPPHHLQDVDMDSVDAPEKPPAHGVSDIGRELSDQEGVDLLDDEEEEGED